jgi:hypothetical protein
MVFSYKCCEVLLSATRPHMLVSCDRVNVFGGRCMRTYALKMNNTTYRLKENLASEQTLLVSNVTHSLEVRFL